MNELSNEIMNEKELSLRFEFVDSYHNVLNQ